MSTIKLSDKAVLANFSVSRWGGHAFDKTVTEKVHKDHEAQRDAGNYNKKLLQKGASLALDSQVYAARNYHRAHTLPWLDDGVRILPSSRYMEYAKEMGNFRQNFEKEVNNFIKEYPAHIKAAKALLGKLFKEDDYPNAQQLRRSYDWRMIILPFPDTQDFRVSGQAVDLDEVRKGMEKQLEVVWHGAMADLGSRISEVVGRMSERLKGYKPGKEKKRAEGTFKDSLVTNVQELVDILPSLNLAGDKKLAKIIARMQEELCKHDAGLLRDDVKLRAKVAQSADQILTSISDFIA